MVFEMAKVDSSCATFWLVHNSIGMAPIDMLGSEEQRARLLPDLISLKKVVCFGLTEPDTGSDASHLETTAKKVNGGWIINGHKRWIGNADICAYCVVWAKNMEEGGKVQGFVVENGTPGYTPRKI
jgi:acyl-CoA oxidase